MEQHPDTPRHEMAAALGITKSNLDTVLSRLRAQPQTRALTPIERLVELMAHQQPVTAEHAARVLGVTAGHFSLLVTRLRSRGFDIVAVKGWQRPTTFRLLLGETHGR